MRGIGLMLMKWNSKVIFFCSMKRSDRIRKWQGQAFSILVSFLCSFSGWQGNGYSCQDIDECKSNNGGCSTVPMVQCINTMGSFHCGFCPPGKMDIFFLYKTMERLKKMNVQYIQACLMVDLRSWSLVLCKEVSHPQSNTVIQNEKPKLLQLLMNIL